jgi:hypothetical protein
VASILGPGGHFDFFAFELEEEYPPTWSFDAPDSARRLDSAGDRLREASRLGRVSTMVPELQSRRSSSVISKAMRMRFVLHAPAHHAAGSFLEIGERASFRVLIAIRLAARPDCPSEIVEEWFSEDSVQEAHQPLNFNLSSFLGTPSLAPPSSLSAPSSPVSVARSRCTEAP